MRPLLLKGHERSLTQVKFNREGDLLFSVAKDKTLSVWYSSNGERIGTFDGHIGTIWSLDVDRETEFVVTLSADFSVKLWRLSNGECYKTWKTDTPARWAEFVPGDASDKFLIVTDQVMGLPGAISIYSFDRLQATDASVVQPDEPILRIQIEKTSPKVTCASWSYLGKYIIAGHQDGSLSKYDAATGELITSKSLHELNITDIQMSEDKTYFITASKDKTAKICDVDNLDVLKVYELDVQMNTACITPLKDFVILGGGQEAREVTTTSSQQGKFEARFYHKIFEDEIGRVKGHFGPLNCVAIHPKGTMYLSGGEDGYIRLHTFDKSYFDFKYDVEKTAAATATATATAASSA